MKKDKDLEQYLIGKRDEIVWSLVSQGYKSIQISKMFSNMSRSNTHKIVKKCPKGYKSPWVKSN